MSARIPRALRHPLRQLDRQAVQHGVLRLDLLPLGLQQLHDSRRGDQYIAGAIILAAAPCTAMVFVWSYLTDGDPGYTLVQVSVNDLLMLVFFALSLSSSCPAPRTWSSLSACCSPRSWSSLSFRWRPGDHPHRTHQVQGCGVVHRRLPAEASPGGDLALLATLVLIFAFQADNITGRPFHVLLIAVPITIQVYFNSSLAYGLMRWLKVPYAIAARALIGQATSSSLRSPWPSRSSGRSPARRSRPWSVCSWRSR